MFGFGNAPMKNSMNFKFGAPEPDPLGTFRSRFSLAPDTTLEEDAAAIPEEKPINNFKATRAFMDYVQNTPKREDYQLGKWGKVGAAITAGLAGFNNPIAGVELGQELRNRPYTYAMQDYATKGKGLEAAAGIESDMYGHDLNFQKMMMEYGDKLADNKREDIRTGIQRDTLTAQQQHWKDQFEQNKSKMEADGWQKFIDKDGNEKLINTVTKETRDLGPSIENSKLKVSQVNANANMTRAGAAVTTAGAAVRNAATGEQNAKTNATNAETNKGRLAVDQAALENAKRNTDSLIADRDMNKLTQPEFELRAQAAAAKELILEHPEYSAYVNEDGTIKTDMLNNNRWGWDDDAEKEAFTQLMRKKINDIRGRKRGQKVEDGTVRLPGITIPPGGN